MREVKKSIVVIDILCAVLWTVRTIIDIVTKTYEVSMLLFVLNLTCMVLWIGASIRWAIVFSRQRKESRTQDPERSSSSGL